MVFMTGGAFTTHARDFLDRVPNARVDKPFDVRALRALVRARVEAGRGPPVEPGGGGSTCDGGRHGLSDF